VSAHVDFGKKLRQALLALVVLASAACATRPPTRPARVNRPARLPRPSMMASAGQQPMPGPVLMFRF
jgi:hypothetical protein